MCRCGAKTNLEEHFPHRNWVIVLSFQVLISTIFSVMSPSIYQFVTSPHKLPEELKNNEDEKRFWPGLGGSDADYGWVLVAHPLFETGSLPLTVLTVRRLPFSLLLYIFVILAAFGGGVYALANKVWVAFVGRALMGAGIAFGAATIHTYMGEMGTMMDNIREKNRKKPRKFMLYIAFSFLLNGGFTLPYVLNSIIANFKNINPYRWPGWAVTVLASLLGVVVLFFFTETRSIPKVKCSNVTCSCLAGLRLSSQLKSGSTTRFMTYIFVIFCGYTDGKVYAILLTLVTPVLSDQFGFNVEYTSHFLIGISVAFLSTSFIHLGAKIVKINNRILLGFCFFSAFIGSILVGDWQSLRHDPCSISNASVLEMGSGSNISEMSGYEQLLVNCEAQSNTSHECFFNPQSRITGEFCNTCLPVCLSKQATINFYQFSAGILLLSISAPLGFVFSSAIASEITSVETQGAVLSLLVGSGAFSRAVSPIWFVESYDLTSRHTYIPMAITAGCTLVLLIGLAAFYKKLAPLSLQVQDAAVVNATSILSVDSSQHTELEDIWIETPL